MKKKVQKHPFEKIETGYHEAAKKILCDWVDGIPEMKFYYGDTIAFVPDVTCMNGHEVKEVYEVVYSHPLTGRKLAMMEAWAYINGTGFSVFEISADWILKQTKKPEQIETMELYEINPIL